MASTYLQRTFSGAGNRKTWTMSMWMKRTVNVPSGTDRVWGWKSGGGNYGFQFDNDQLRFYLVSGGSSAEFLTNRHFRDIHGWYHLVAKCDTTQSTESDRFKIYVNGVQETSFATATYPNLNEDTAINQAEICRLGCNVVATNSFFEGLLSHVHFTDGYAYDASTFGSTDPTTGEWRISTAPSITMGTNGFTILKDGNTITDQSSNSNDFTLGAGTLIPTVDNPSNCFATLNPLTRINTSQTPSKSFNNANTTFEVGSNVWGEAMSTLAVSSGKYYVEFNIEKLEASNGYAHLGVMDYDLWGTTNNTYQYFLSNTASAGIGLDYRTGQSGLRSAASVVSSNVGDFSNGNKIGLAVDMDNKAMYVHLNGTYYQVGGVTGVPTSGASKTGALTIPAACTLVGIGCACYSTDARIAANYGNGYFRTTAVSSAQNPDDGKGIFEYDVPAGYTALSTGGLNQ